MNGLMNGYMRGWTGAQTEGWVGRRSGGWMSGCVDEEVERICFHLPHQPTQRPTAPPSSSTVFLLSLLVSSPLGPRTIPLVGAMGPECGSGHQKWGLW